MKLIFFAFSLTYFCMTVIPATHRGVIVMLDKNYVCHIKRSCLECLKLPHCSWCANESKCFSEQLIPKKGYCENSTIHHIEYGMSITENAECSCAGGDMKKNCVSPGTAKKEECSGPDRGKCVCGRCFCNPNPDPHNTTKAVMGEYCEYDNFSCNGAKCNEGPYNINEQKYDEENILIVETDIAENPEE